MILIDRTRCRVGALVVRAIAIVIAAACGATAAHAWDDRSAGADTPWLGTGGRAHLYFQQSACMGCTTGFRNEQRWGRSAWAGEDPYVTVGKAMRFLFADAGIAKSAKAIGAGSIGDDSGIIEPRALPYHMTVVMIEPTVIVMNFDLGALIHEGETREGQVIGTPYIDGFLTYGTRIPATGSLLWFSPAAKVAPTPVAKQMSGRGEIVARGVALVLERRGDAWFVIAK